MEEKKKYQYWMRCIPGIGNKKLKKIVEYCGSAKEAYGLSVRQLRNIRGIGEKDAENILESKRRFDLEGEPEILEEREISMITIEDEGYPQRLMDLNDGPYALFYRGKLPSEEEKTAAIVGARLCSSYGRAAGLELGERLARCGVGIVSGMASGIDSFGHWGAVRGGGKTYAVLGCGTDVCYPKGGKDLYETIQKNGAVISEYLPGTPPFAAQFPARNRIISGLSDVVIIIEAKKKSGSLITVDFALEQGKDIYAVPGRMDDALSRGCNELIRQGSGIVVSADELIEELGVSPAETAAKEEAAKKPLEKEESMVYSCFGLHPRNMEELVNMTNLPSSVLADLLIRLQTKGLIEEYFKNHYRKK